MAEEKKEDKEIRPTLLNPQYRRLIIATGVVIVLLTVTSWAGSVRTNRAKVDTFRSAASAIAVALRQDIMDANSQRTDTGRARLGPLVTNVAKAGGYRVVTVTDEDGKVLASTDTSLEGESVETDGFSAKSTDVRKTNYGYQATAPIKIGESVIGYLLIDADS